MPRGEGAQPSQRELEVELVHIVAFNRRHGLRRGFAEGESAC